MLILLLPYCPCVMNHHGNTLPPRPLKCLLPILTNTPKSLFNRGIRILNSNIIATRRHTPPSATPNQAKKPGVSPYRQPNSTKINCISRLDSLHRSSRRSYRPAHKSCRVEPGASNWNFSFRRRVVTSTLFPVHLKPLRRCRPLLEP